MGEEKVIKLLAGRDAVANSHGGAADAAVEVHDASLAGDDARAARAAARFNQHGTGYAIIRQPRTNEEWAEVLGCRPDQVNWVNCSPLGPGLTVPGGAGQRPSPVQRTEPPAEGL